MTTLADLLDASIVAEETGTPAPAPADLHVTMPKIQRYLDSARKAYQIELADQERIRAVWLKALWEASLSPRSRRDTERWDPDDDDCCPYCGNPYY